LKIPLQKSESPQDLRYILGDMTDEYDQVLVDTAALNPFDKDDVKTLARIMGAGNAEGHLVLPAGGDSDETGEMARIFATLGIHSLIPTRLDMARRLGGILSAAHMGGLTFSDASNTPKVADGLLPLDPQTLSRLLMPAAFKTQRQGQKTPSAPYKRTRQ
jgi:flagellar biosynthesis protein FlhF